MKRARRGKRAQGQEIRTRIVSRKHVQHVKTVASPNHDAGKINIAEPLGEGRVTRNGLFGGAK